MTGSPRQSESLNGFAGAEDRSSMPSTAAKRWMSLLDRFDPISLSQASSLAMPNRVDTKFVLTEQQLYSAVVQLTEDYWILDIHSVRLSAYRTLYFDTDHFALYLRHHAGGRNAYKVRSRKYLDTDQSFLEIKRKTDTNRTIKYRIETPEFLTRMTRETHNFMDTYFPHDPERLSPKLWNNFNRMSFVAKDRPERLTLDLNLAFYTRQDSATLPGIAVGEVKQERASRDSEFVRQMRAMGIRPTGFSKYCIGVSKLCETVKHNRMKPKLRMIEKLMRGCDLGE